MGHIDSCLDTLRRLIIAGDMNGLPLAEQLLRFVRLGDKVVGATLQSADDIHWIHWLDPKKVMPIKGAAQA